MLRINENRIETMACPFCGSVRPTDWFGPELKHVEYEKGTLRVKKVVRYRKYKACWKCREVKRINATNTPPEGGVKYGEPERS